jgi:hypothetical protein
MLGAEAMEKEGEEEETVLFLHQKSDGHISQISTTSAWLIKSTKFVTVSLWPQQEEQITAFGSSMHRLLGKE